MKYLFVALLACLGVPVLGQNHLVKLFTEQDGLPNRNVTAYSFDRNGKLLLGTSMGLTVYDGKRFKNISSIDGTNLKLISWMKAYKNGQVWFQMMGNIYCYENEKLSPLTAYNKFHKEPGTLHRLYPIGKNKVVLDFMMPRRNLLFQRIRGKWKLLSESRGNNFSVIYRNPKNREEMQWKVFPGRDNDSILILVQNLQSGKLWRFPFEARMAFHTTLSTPEASYHAFSNHFFHLQANGQLRKKIMPFFIHGVYEGWQQTLWLRDTKDGLYQIDLKDLAIIREYHFSDYQIYEAIQDRYGGLWLAMDKGLGYIPFKPHMEYHFRDHFQSEVSQFIFCHDSILIGHFNGDAGLWKPGQKEKIIYRTPYRQSHNIYNIVAMQFDEKGNIAFTSENGLFLLNRKTLQVKQLSELPCTRIFKRRDGSLLVCSSYDQGVSHLKNGKLYPFREKELSGIRHFSVLETEQGDLLAGGGDQLYILPAKSGSPKRRIKLPLSDLSCLAAYKKGKMLAGTYGDGLFIIGQKDTTWLTIKDGLTSNHINSILVDRKERIWLATSHGITRITESEGRYIVQRIAGPDCLNIDNFFLAEKNGEIWVSSFDGLMKINPEKIHRKTGFYPLHMEEIWLNKQRFTPSDSSVAFTYGADKLLRLHFSLTTFSNQDDKSYFYRILGLSKKWNPLNGEELTITNLSPGKYTVEIYAELKNSGQKSNVIRLDVDVHPQFWQNPWFIIPFMLLILGVAFLLIRNVFRKQKKKHQVASEVAKLQANIIRAQMNPHFMFNAINSIQGYILALENDSAYFYLGKFSKLLRKIISMSKNDFVLLEEELDFLANYIELEQMRCGDKFSYSIETGSGVDPQQQQVPVMILQPFVENAILHGLLPKTGEKGQLSIEIRREDDLIYCEVTDNGIGREAAQKIKESKKKEHKSAAIQLTRERIKLFRKLYSDKFELEITDLFDEHNRPLGTRVVAIFPLKHERNENKNSHH